MADPASLPPLPKNHLDHPENWATGTEPATEKQKGFIKVLEGQHPDAVPEDGIDVAHIGKSEASEVIDKLKNGKKVTSAGVDDAKKATEATEAKDADAYDEMKETEETKTPDDAASDKPTRAKPTTSHSASSNTGEKRKSAPTAAAPTDKDASKAKSADDEMGRDEEEDAPSDDSPEDGERVTKKNKTVNGEEKDETAAKKSSTTKRTVVDTARETSPAPKDGVEPADGVAVASKKNTNGAQDETIPGDGEHLDHPENWATGDEPATEKQKGFLAVLEKKAGEPVENMEGLGKSEASAKIDELK